jgi:hypothetical protein
MTKSCDPKPDKCAPPKSDHPDHPDHPAHPQPVNDCPPPDHNPCDYTHAALVSGQVGVDHIAQADVSLFGCHDLIDLNVCVDIGQDGYHA